KRIRAIENEAGMGLARQVIKLARTDFAKNAAQCRRVRQIAVMEKQTLAVDLFVAPQMLNPRTEQIARPADDSMNRVALFQKQLSQIRAVLPGDAGDECTLIVAH